MQHSDGHIDAMPRDAAVRAMIASHAAAAEAVASAVAEIDAAAGLLASTFETGGAVYYAAAGSSGLMALADASELPGTFGVPQRQIRVCMAGGVPVDGVMPGATEDDAASAREAAEAMTANDLAIVVSASGTTPYALAYAEAARERGARVVAIANVSGSPLLALGDVAIAVPTAPEVIDGSTRLGAGTAQKVALNAISTQAGILMGHVHDGLMVNLVADNIKLRKRAETIVMRIARVTEARAKAALDAAGHDTKRAVLIAAGLDPATARDRLDKAGGRLRDCLQDINEPTTGEKT